MEKQRKQVAVCHEKIRNQRKDFHHKLSHELAERYDAVAVEDLDMKAMSRCLHLGKGVMDNGYGMFRDMLAHKLEDRGKKLIKVDRFYVLLPETNTEVLQCLVEIFQDHGFLRYFLKQVCLIY